MKTKSGIYYFLILAGVLFSLYRVHMAYQWVDINAADNRPAVQPLFIAPSICTYNTGIFLAHCTSMSDIVPVEDAFPGDLGYTLLSNIATSVKKNLFGKTSALSKESAVKINIWLNWLGVVFLAFAVLIANLKSTSVITLFTGAYFLQGKEISMDYYGSLFGVFCIAIGGVIFFSLANNRNYYKYRILFFLISLFALMSALLLREPLGQIGMVSALFILLVSCVREKARWYHKILKYGIMALMVYSITLAPAALLTARNKIWHIPQGKGHPKHAISHSLLIGLGNPNTPNSWGITRSDVTGVLLVKNIDPSIVYSTKQYYVILRDVYLKMFMEKPLEIMNIYRLNMLRTLGSPTNIMSYYAYIAALFILMLTVSRGLEGRLRIIFIMISGLGVASCLAIMQGVLSHIWYASVAEIGFAVSISALFEIFIENQKIKNVSTI